MKELGGGGNPIGRNPQELMGTTAHLMNDAQRPCEMKLKL